MIEARSLSKWYGDVEAVHEASFSIDDEQVVGLLGPNGAGKTTIMKMLTCYHFPTSGDAVVHGHSISEDPIAVKKLIGYLPESAPLYGEMLVDEYLSFIADARGLNSKKKRGRMELVASDCGLSSVRKKRIDELSKGFRQRVAFAQAIIHDPPILILDEPTTGLDPNQIVEIRSLIRELGKSKTVILSSHILQEVEAVCSSVLIVHDGRIAAHGTTEEISANVKGHDVFDIIVKGADADSLRALLPSVIGFVSAVGFEEAVPCGSGQIAVAVTVSSDAAIPGGERLFDWARAANLKLLSLTRRKVSLEDIFMKMTREGGPA